MQKTDGAASQDLMTEMTGQDCDEQAKLYWSIHEIIVLLKILT